MEVCIFYKKPFLPIKMVKRVDQIIKVIIPEIDLIVIDNVKQLRNDKKISQVKLSNMIDESSLGFVGKVEILTENVKYNKLHIVKIARALNCKMTDIIPEYPPENDYIEVTLHRTNITKKDGTLSNSTHTVRTKKRPLTSKESEDYRKSRGRKKSN